MQTNKDNSAGAINCSEMTLMYSVQKTDSPQSIVIRRLKLDPWHPCIVAAWGVFGACTE